MAAQSTLARLGVRTAILGSVASLAIAAPLTDGEISMDAHSGGERIGLFFGRDTGAEKLSVVVRGVESFSVREKCVLISPSALPAAPEIGMLAVDIEDLNLLKWYDGTSWQVAGAGGSVTPPAGANYEVQWNDGGAFGASQFFRYLGGSGYGAIEISNSNDGSGASPTVVLSGYSAPGFDLGGRLVFANQGSPLFQWSTVNPETGSDSGSDLQLRAFGSDGGAWDEAVFTVSRAQGGAVTWERPVTHYEYVAFAPSTTALGSIEIPVGAAPLAPVEGQIWNTGDGCLYAYLGGFVVDLAATGGGGTPGGADTNVQINSGGSFAGSNNFTYAPGLGTAYDLNVLRTAAPDPAAAAGAMRVNYTLTPVAASSLATSNAYGLKIDASCTSLTGITTNSSTALLGLEVNVSSPNSGSNFGLVGQRVTVGVGTATTSNAYGFNTSVTGGPGTSMTNMYGHNLSVNKSGGGNVASLRGMYAAVIASGAGTVTEASALAASVTLTSSTVTTSHGLYVEQVNSNATGYGIRVGTVNSTTTTYGLYIGTLFGATVYGVYQADSGATNVFEGKVNISASGTTRAGLNLAPGTAPSGPINGDMWITSAALQYRVNGVTISAVGGTGAANRIGVWSGTNALSSSSSFTSTADSGVQLILNNGTHTGTVSSTYIRNNVALAPASPSTAIYRGFQSTLSAGNTGNMTGATVTGIDTNITLATNVAGAGWGNITGVNATVDASITASSGSPTISSITAGSFVASHSNSGGSSCTISSVTALYAQNVISGSATKTITNLYGLYIANTISGVTTITNRYGVYQADASSRNVFEGNIEIATAGKSIGIKEGANAKMGIATLVGGTVTVNTTAVAANSRIFLATNVVGGTAGHVSISARVAGTSFTITSTSGTDTSQIAWWIVDAL